MIFWILTLVFFKILLSLWITIKFLYFITFWFLAEITNFIIKNLIFRLIFMNIAKRQSKGIFIASIIRMIRLGNTYPRPIYLLIFLLLIFDIELILVEVMIQSRDHLCLYADNRLAIGQKWFFVFLQWLFILWTDCENYWNEFDVNVFFCTHMTYDTVWATLIHFLLKFRKRCFLPFQFI